MISVCIPIYNCDATLLVNELSEQAKLLNRPCEIILIDDRSDERYRMINKLLGKENTYIELPENVGRAKIRNLFLKYAKYEYLLFLDCDVRIRSDDFLSKYFDMSDYSPSVLCGGSVYETDTPGRNQLLRWKYGKYRESKSAAVRKENAYESFRVENCLIKKEVLEAVKFDERIAGYGHEDTFLGYSLKMKGIPVSHFDNPVMNTISGANADFLRKTEEGIRTLADLMKYSGHDEAFADHIRILRFYGKVRKFQGGIYVVFIALKPLLVFLLSGRWVNLYLFDFYKLGLLIGCRRSK